MQSFNVSATVCVISHILKKKIRKIKNELGGLLSQSDEMFVISNFTILPIVADCTLFSIAFTPSEIKSYINCLPKWPIGTDYSHSICDLFSSRMLRISYLHDVAGSASCVSSFLMTVPLLLLLLHLSVSQNIQTDTWYGLLFVSLPVCQSVCLSVSQSVSVHFSIMAVILVSIKYFNKFLFLCYGFFRFIYFVGILVKVEPKLIFIFIFSSCWLFVLCGVIIFDVVIICQFIG